MRQVAKWTQNKIATVVPASATCDQSPLATQDTLSLSLAATTAATAAAAAATEAPKTSVDVDDDADDLGIVTGVLDITGTFAFGARAPVDADLQVGSITLARSLLFITAHFTLYFFVPRLYR
jgi:hypothetical protein